MINSKSITIPASVTKTGDLSLEDIGVYVKICNTLSTYKVYERYPVELISSEENIKMAILKSSLDRLRIAGFVFVDEDGFVSLRKHKQIYPTNFRPKCLYIGDYPDGISKVGVTKSFKDREASLSTIRPFITDTVYKFSLGGTADHIEKLVKKHIPLQKQDIPGGTECFLTEHKDTALALVDEFIRDNYCGEVIIEKRKLGEVWRRGAS